MRSTDLSNTVRVAPLWRTLLFSVMTLTSASVAIAETKPTDVVVSLPKDLDLPQANVLIYRLSDKDGEWPTVQADVAREMENEVTIPLPDGQFVAEIGAVVGNKLTLLRSSPFRVPETTRVSLLAEEHSCAAMIASGAAHVRQVALRRLGNGEVRWSSENT